MQTKIFKIFFFLLFLTNVSCSTETTNFVHSDHQLATLNIKLGLFYLEQGKVTAAEKKLLQALQQDSKNYEAYDAYAYYLERQNEILLAEKYYLQAIAMAVQKGAAYNNYGTFLYRQHRYQLATKYFLMAAHDSQYFHRERALRNAEICLHKE